MKEFDLKEIYFPLLKSIIKSTNDAIYVKDVSGRYVLFNAGAEKITGKDAKSALGKDDFFLFTYDEAMKVIQGDKKIIDERCIVTQEEILTDSNGKISTYLNTKGPLLDENNQLIGIFGLTHDITERTNLGHLLIESEERYRLLFNSTQQGIALHEIIEDKNGKVIDYVYIDINESYTKIVGITREMSIGKRVTEVIPEVEQYWIENYGTVAQTGVAKYYENFLEKTGRYYATYSFSPKKKQFAVIVEDITERKITEEKLIESEQKFKALFESSGLGIGFYSPEGIIISYNLIAAKNMGGEPKDFVGKSLFELYPKDDAKIYFDRIQSAMESNDTLYFEDKMKLPFGELWFTNVLSRIFNKKGNIIGIQIISSDITERKQMEITLRESEERLSILYNNAPLGYQSLDENGNFLEVNKTWLNIMGYSEKEVIGKWFGDFLAPEFVEPFKVRFPLFKELGSIHSEFEMIRKDKTHLTIGFDGRIGHKKDGSFEKTYCILQDITESKKNQDHIKYLSYHDHLTGLYNRRFFEEELRRLDTERNLPLTILMGDVNGLKLINDSFGHSVGDELLKVTAESIKKACRADDIVARLGGDEFVVILPNTGEVEVNQIIKRIKENLKCEKVQSLEVSVAFGFETKTCMHEDVSQLLKSSEDNMYKHKLYESSSSRSETINLIMNALFEKNNREMFHSQRVSDLCQAIAKKMKFETEVIKQIRITGLMHDIGKIGIDEKILNSDQSLNKEEWFEIRKHPEIGSRILGSSNEFFDISVDVLQHHERWDGKGYPNGLKGKEISLKARIIALADTYDAMMSDRAYRKAFTNKQAIDEITRCSGTQFDPEIVQVFLEMIQEEAKNI